MMRSLTKSEEGVIRAIASLLPLESQRQLLCDLEFATAYSVLPDNSLVKFCIAGYKRPPYVGQHSFGVEGELLDRDGSKISLLLFADQNGRLLELEFIRWGDGGLIDPDWATLNLYGT